MGRVDEKKLQKRNSLLQTAFELFTTKGVVNTSISDIADRAGVAKGTFYLYFKDKIDIKNKLIGHKTEIRPGAFIRGSALVGDNCVVGNSTELKNVILFDNVQVPHYNYVGDSILGYRSHMGAGSITSNVKSDKQLVSVKCGEEKIETGMKKIGAMLGDRVEVGCNSVLNPGTVVGRDSNIYPTSCVRGTVPERSIWKNNGKIAAKHE